MKNKKSALDSALFYLGFRNRTERELKKYLEKKEYDSNEIHEAINRLKELNYIDDSRFIENYLISHYKSSIKSRKEIYFKLLNFDLDRELIDLAFDQMDSNIEFENAVRFLEKQMHLNENGDSDDLREKIKQKAMIHGFSYSTITKAFNKIIWKE